MPGRILSTNATIALSLIVRALACTSSKTSLTSPTDTKCEVNLSNSPSSFAANGGTGTLTVTTTRDCNWTISTDVVWVSIPGPRDGQGDASISYSVAVNPVPSARSGLVAAGSMSVQLSQAAAVCRYSLSRSSDTIGAAGGQLSVDMSTLTGCSWTATSGTSWISITSGQAGNANGSVAVVVSANSGAERVGQVNVAGQLYTVTQAARAIRSSAADASASSATDADASASSGADADASATRRHRASADATLLLPPRRTDISTSFVAREECRGMPRFALP